VRTHWSMEADQSQDLRARQVTVTDAGGEGLKLAESCFPAAAFNSAYADSFANYQ
jgi:hypothetical protein